MGRRFFSSDRLDAFRRDGFVVVPGLFDGAMMERMSSWADELQASPESPGATMKYFENDLLRSGERVLSRVENFAPYHPGFGELADGDELLGRTSELFGEPAVLFKEKLNFKLPGGDGFKAHQDVQAGWDTYAGLFITALVSIDESTIENGCLELAAGHHTAGLIGERWRPLDDNDLAGVEFVALPAAPGDAIFFGGYPPHRSDERHILHDRNRGKPTEFVEQGSTYQKALVAVREPYGAVA